VLKLHDEGFYDRRSAHLPVRRIRNDAEQIDVTMIDLHMHSTSSDGSYDAAALPEIALAQGLNAIALTDHDTVGGVDAFLAACESVSAQGEHVVRGVTGVEVSVSGRLGSMHLLGYNFDHHHAEMVRVLERIGGERRQRNETILNNLNDRGFGITMEQVAGLAGGDIVGRPHFAQALLDGGHVATRREAFDRYIGDRGSCYETGFRFSVEEAIACIHSASGVAVLAHPFVLRLGTNALDAYVGELAEMGLDGLELHYPEHTGRQMREITRLTEKYNLIGTGGSDFHGAPNPDIRMGLGFGTLNVPDSVLDTLEARCAALKT
jgi:3',5'-nucleoside bisphosphate phosphatase